MFLSTSDWPGAHSTIARRCELWGGAAHLLFPMTTGNQLDAGWQPLFEEADVDSAEGLEVPVKLAYPHHLLAMLVARNQPRDQLRTVRVSAVAEDDPWSLAYLGVLGL